MKEVLKILFDLSFYYALSGYFFYLFTGNNPSAWGMLLLTISACAFIRLRHIKAVLICSIASCAIPGALFAFGISFWQIIQFLPAWAFLVFTLLSGRIHTTREDFQKHFSFTGRLFLLTILGVFAFARIEGVLAGAIAVAIPYAILYLMVGVCLMRILRDDGKLTVMRNIIVLLVLLLVSIAFAMLQAPQLVLNTIGFIYQHIISRLLVGIATAIGYAISLLNFRQLEYNQDESTHVPEWALGPDGSIDGSPEWLAVVAIIFILPAAIAIFLIFRRLLGNKKTEKRVRVYTEEHERLQKPERGGIRVGILRPRDPRLAVRWYYRKYLKEGIVRGAKPSHADTSKRILQKYNPFFPSEGAEKLRELYIVSRYNYNKEIPKSDPDNAAKAWRELRLNHHVDM